MKPIIAELIRKAAEEALREVRAGNQPNIKDIVQSPQVREVVRIAEREIEAMPGEKPQYKSKIILTQVIGLAASLLIAYGIELDAETQAGLVVIVQGIVAGATYIWRKWFTHTELK